MARNVIKRESQTIWRINRRLYAAIVNLLQEKPTHLGAKSTDYRAACYCATLPSSKTRCSPLTRLANQRVIFCRIKTIKGSCLDSQLQVVTFDRISCTLPFHYITGHFSSFCCAFSENFTNFSSKPNFENKKDALRVT